MTKFKFLCFYYVDLPQTDKTQSYSLIKKFREIFDILYSVYSQYKYYYIVGFAPLVFITLKIFFNLIKYHKNSFTFN